MEYLKRAPLVSWLIEGGDSPIERWLRVLVPLVLGSLLGGSAVNAFKLGGLSLSTFQRAAVTVLGVVFVALALSAIAIRVPKQAVQRILRNHSAINSTIQAELEGKKDLKYAAIRRILQASRTISKGTDLQIAYLEWDGKRFRGIAGDPEPDADFYEESERLSESSCARAAIGSGAGASHEVYSPDVTKESLYRPPRPPKSARGALICVPVMRHDKAIGVVCAALPTVDGFAADDKEVIRHYAQTVALIYAILELRDQPPYRLLPSYEALYDTATQLIQRTEAGFILSSDLRFTPRHSSEDTRQETYLTVLKDRLDRSEHLACLRVVGASDPRQCATLRDQSDQLLTLARGKLDMRFFKQNPLGIDVLVTPTDLLLAFTGLHANRTGIVIEDATIARRVMEWFQLYVWSSSVGYFEVERPEDFSRLCGGGT
jgi:hypothetical protein